MSPTPSGLKGLLALAFSLQANQLVDSSVPTTREFWRRKLGFSEAVAKSHLSLAEAVVSEEGR